MLKKFKKNMFYSPRCNSTAWTFSKPPLCTADAITATANAAGRDFTAHASTIWIFGETWIYAGDSIPANTDTAGRRCTAVATAVWIFAQQSSCNDYSIPGRRNAVGRTCATATTTVRTKRTGRALSTIRDALRTAY